MMELPYLLKRENICRIEDGRILIGDRRVFPFKRRFEVCTSVEEIAGALQSMVTQGGGPLEVALTTMVYVAKQMREGRLPRDPAVLERACDLLIAARPTNTTMKRVIQGLLAELTSHPSDWLDLVEPKVEAVQASFDHVYEVMGRFGSSLLGPENTILTTCFAEHTFLLSLAYAQAEGNYVRVIANETRPYLQGSRLTAPSLQEMGIEVQLITDGMGATVISEHMVTHYMTAADVVCLDGTVVNKVGTLSNALAAHAYGVPYYAFSVSPDPTKRGRQDLVMEMRSAGEVTQCLGRSTTKKGIGALYPAFDSIPAELVRGIVTAKGVLSPHQIQRSFS
jgi:methylthioribose-1-phosphate isomerase